MLFPRLVALLREGGTEVESCSNSYQGEGHRRATWKASPEGIEWDPEAMHSRPRPFAFLALGQVKASVQGGQQEEQGKIRVTTL